MNLAHFFFLSLTLFSLSTSAADTKRSDHIEKILASLLPNVDAKQLDKFKYKDCNIQKEKWVMLFATKIPFKEEVKFSDKCDLQGEFVAKMQEYFPFELKVKNLKGISKISGKLKISLIFTQSSVLKLEMIQAKYLDDKFKVGKNFQMTYSFEIDPLNPTKIIKKDLGGKLDFIKDNKIYKTVKLD